VAKNDALRGLVTDIARKNNLSVNYPPPHLCTDNGVMIAWAGVELILAGKAKLLLDDELNSVDVRPRWPLSQETIQEIFPADYPRMFEMPSH
jgi:N6-L-threonylcarbamoyladenine synthase